VRRWCHTFRRYHDACVVKCSETEDPSNYGNKHEQTDEQVVSENVLNRDVTAQLIEFVVDARCVSLADGL